MLVRKSCFCQPPAAWLIILLTTCTSSLSYLQHRTALCGALIVVIQPNRTFLSRYWSDASPQHLQSLSMRLPLWVHTSPSWNEWPHTDRAVLGKPRQSFHCCGKNRLCVRHGYITTLPLLLPASLFSLVWGQNWAHLPFVFFQFRWEERVQQLSG